MVFKRALIWIICCGMLAELSSCKKADNPQDAAAILTQVPLWKIDEISVNDATTFRDGKMTQQFGGIDFERYMETVELRKDGTFSGIFKGETKPFLLKWKQNEQNITVGAVESDVKGGEWIIDPKEVSKEFFTMKTTSTAYDYPRETKISLKFKAGN